MSVIELVLISLGSFVGYNWFGLFVVKYVVESEKTTSVQLGLIFVFWPLFLALQCALFILAAVWAILETFFWAFGRYLSRKVKD